MPDPALLFAAGLGTLLLIVVATIALAGLVAIVARNFRPPRLLRRYRQAIDPSGVALRRSADRRR